MKRTLILMAGMAVLAAPVAADAQNRGKRMKRDNQAAMVRELNQRQLAQINSGAQMNGTMQGGMSAGQATMGAGSAQPAPMGTSGSGMSGSGMAGQPTGDMNGTATGMQGQGATDPATGTGSDPNGGSTPPRL